MVEIYSLEMDKARQRAGRAELALERAEELLDGDGNVAVNLALCCRIRGAQRRVSEARARLRKIESARTERLRIG
ncbi:hypothetical protein EN833_19370 [Mesorhizobium sp. M4B.F.Ca.ET.190.01.1.1]|uniref:Tetratricopeptide repeat protein n=1 Tax=Mesorhizobium abyssinicae TaxID=1209958 RepID=A0ABU5AUX4_9HYPH|nr:MULTISPECIES: hypothetical protein [Mesorhizobium]RWF62852.1 MAG: hypothetical protein EOS47_21615 [Mesorhizobium sp.]MDX8541108.1 hypothetical protein [Mesorhizobium abyssinicae]TGQ34537.1 hypothetical protein EN857_21020 [Mesorhizobium sp. M4B.F.Ca.ET.214.01.1.1]TGQ58805.1 hypothetical protein EN854_22215 [Mesorhizobium sp. M4B.F.Ca.ET.211.01.1.1]TGR08305.1 hypothetical protein EN843_19360 [Mesorhizobium sp. M4B.F.Ca.ET.200.01.1.1]